jgi:hypothetical protein
VPIAVGDERLAASPGRDAKRVEARRALAMEFFREHLYEADGAKDWSVVRRAMQTVDLAYPVERGPAPSAPKRLVALPLKNGLGPGFFGAAAHDGLVAEAYAIAPEALYLRYVAPAIRDQDEPVVRPEEMRYFLPQVRQPKGARVATKERA